jgi:signal transduction histidine kinase
MTPQKIAQNANSCRETADFLGKRLIVKDITTDPLWTEFKQLVLSHGLTAYWSEPILSGKGQFFGTFELYFRDARAPNSGELTIIESLARLTSLILERKHLEVAKLKNTKELEYAYYELKRTQARLIQSEKISSLGRMVAGIAHEINNPLSFIHGNLNHAKNYFEDLMELVKLYQQTYPYPTPEIEALISEIDLDFMVGDWSKLLSSMRVGTQRIADIVVSLKNFSRLDEQELKTVDIHEGIDSTLLILQHRLRSEGDCASASAKGDHPEIEVIKNYGQLPKFKCYVSQLNQVFLHILNNSIDALQNKSYPRRITISTEVSNEYCSIVRDKKQHTTSCIVIKIADNGHGMSEETQQRIFDPFFTTKPVGSGTGLGLAISHQIVVEKHRGQIRCISELGQKTEMIVELPLIMSNR